MISIDMVIREQLVVTRLISISLLNFNTCRVLTSRLCRLFLRDVIILIARSTAFLALTTPRPCVLENCFFNLDALQVCQVYLGI